MKVTQARSVLLEPLGRGLTWWSGFSIRKAISSSAGASLRRFASGHRSIVTASVTRNGTSVLKVGGEGGGRQLAVPTGRSSTVRSYQGWSSPKAMPSVLATSATPRVSLAKAQSSISQPLLSALLIHPTLSTKRHLSTTMHLLNPALFKDSSALALRSRGIRPKVIIKKRLPRQPSFIAPLSSTFTTDASSTMTSTSKTTTVEKEVPLQDRRFGFQVSAAYSAKSGHMRTPHAFSFNPHHHVTPNLKASWLARKKARPDTGQDAFFVSRVNEVGGIALGVADGVGGYIHSGIDSADFSHTLCEHMSCMAQKARPKIFHPRTLLNAAYQRLIEDQEVPGGASTACVGIARPDGVLTVANLGDSGYIICRDGKVLHSSIPQTHAFNTPYQLSVIPPKLLEQSRTFGGDFLCDLPKDAAVTTHNLVHGDVVVFATDGLWDNLSTQQILRIIYQEMIKYGGWVNGDQQVDPATKDKKGGICASRSLELLTETDGTGLQTTIAAAIATKAKSMSLNQSVDGPFAKEVKRLMPQELWYDGGKKDDICVVCLVVVEPKRQEPSSTAKLSPKSAAAKAGAAPASTNAPSSTSSSQSTATAQPSTVVAARAPRNVA